MFRVDDKVNTEVNFYKYRDRESVKIIDGTGDSEAVFNSGYSMLPDDWVTYMTERVKGKDNCKTTGYDGQALPFIPA